MNALDPDQHELLLDDRRPQPVVIPDIEVSLACPTQECEPWWTIYRASQARVEQVYHVLARSPKSCDAPSSRRYAARRHEAVTVPCTQKNRFCFESALPCIRMWLMRLMRHMRVQVIHEARLPVPDPTKDHQLCLQYGRFIFDDGTMEEGFRFIYRKPPKGNLQARGQARIPSHDEAEQLWIAAYKAGWGDLGSKDTKERRIGP